VQFGINRFEVLGVNPKIAQPVCTSKRFFALENKMLVLQRSILELHELKKLISYDPDSGIFTWIIDRTSHARKGKAVACKPHKNTGYSSISVLGVRFLSHRLAWFFENGRLPVGWLDHKNGNRNDNRINNLRLATASENNQNKKIESGNQSGFLGVSYIKKTGKWCAELRLDNKKVFQGTFVTVEMASKAYLEAKRIHHPFCTI
jgi:hypothetical protein